MKTLKILFPYLILFYGISSCIAQNSENGITLINSYLDSIRMEYLTGKSVNNFPDKFFNAYKFLDDKKQLVESGTIYSGYFDVGGSPFLFEKADLNGTIVIQNIPISDVRLLYDIFSDDVICMSSSSSENNYPLIISDISVSSFILYDKHFINQTNLQTGLSGYYELIYEGKNFKLLAKWQKEIFKKTSGNQYEAFSDSRRTIFLVEKNNVKKVKKKKDFRLYFQNLKSGKMSKKKGINIPKPSKATNGQLIRLSEYFDKNLSETN